jgi:hypothetical protein
MYAEESRRTQSGPEHKKKVKKGRDRKGVGGEQKGKRLAQAEGVGASRKERDWHRQSRGGDRRRRESALCWPAKKERKKRPESIRGTRTTAP